MVRVHRRDNNAAGTVRKMLSHQKRTGMTARYVMSRASLAHKAELAGDKRLYEWVMNFKPFLTWGKP